jgi:hypothetical protein
MRTNSSRHDPNCGAANGLGGTRATEIAALYDQLRAVPLRTHLATRASLPPWRDLPPITYWLLPAMVGLPLIIRALVRHPLMRC